MTLARTADYWFSPSAFFVQLNAAGDRNFIHANCSAGSAVMCYMKGVDGLGYDNGHNYKRWTLIASPTAFNDNKEKYVYIAIPKSEAADAVAQFVWPSEKLDIYGYNEAGELIGSEDYYYIWTQGIISASEVNGVRVDREWTQMYETGTLSTDEAFDAERDGLWWRWDPITDTVEFLKTISKAVFEELKADFATIGQLFVEKDARVGGDLNVDGIIWALQGRINDLRSQNFSGSGLGDTGWWLTNDKDGHSYLEVDELLVRMKATFLELEIRKETFTGGNVHYSPAGSVIYRVDYMTADNLLLGYTEVRVPWLLKRMPFLLDKFAYSARRRIRREMTDEEWLRCAKFRCYMMADDGTTATRNWWQVGDQARCQSFNKTKVTAKRNGTYSTTYVNAEDPSEPWSTDFYWRMVIEVGSEILEDGHAYDYVDFAFADQKDAAGNYVNSEADRRAQCIAGSGIPAAGDTIVCMGNRFNPERMNMVSILSVGADAPAIKGYKGINTFSFEGCEVFCISPKKVEIRSNSFKWILDDGKVLPPKMFRGVYVPGTRYHYYDEVSWIGSIWLCIITDEYFWENRQGTRFSANEVRNVQEGEGNFDYTVANLPGMEGDEIYHGEDHYYKQGTVGNQEVFYVRNYTYSEPADTNPSWLKEVSKGTEITQVIEKYSASKDGINHPPEDAQYWHDTIEQTGIVPGQFLWTRTVTYYSDDRTPTEHYSVSRWGIDGDGIADINSYYWSTDILIQDMAAYERENTVNWVDTYVELGDLGLKQGNYVWEKTQIIYDLADDIDGNPRTLPDLVSYRCNRIGADALIGQEEYYCLRTTNNIDTAFQGIDGWGIPWYRGSYANSEGGRINPSGKINDIWKPKMPTYSSGEAKYLWNFEWHVSGDGTQWATTPRCIGNHAKGIKGVIELYALSASKSPISAQVPIPTDINSKNTFGQIPTSNFGDPQVWGDERYDRAPNDKYPYQWNWERTLYSDGTHEDHYHISAVKGTKGEDGAGTEFIYKLTDTETAPAKPTNPSDRTADDVVPTGWTDSPSGISFEHQYEWVSQRTKQTGANWGDFDTPRLWAKWGQNGQDGDGVEYVYIRSKSSTAPTIKNNNAYNGKTYLDDDFLPLAQGANLENSGRCTDDPTGVSREWPYEWVCKRTKGEPDAKTGVREWEKYSGTFALWANFGENGDTPIAVYRWNQSANVAPTISGNAYPPSGWSKTAPDRPGDGYYLWMSSSIKHGNGTIDTWSTPVRISGDKGSAGEDAKEREWIYKRSNTAITSAPASSGTGTVNGVNTQYKNTIDDWVPSGWTDNPLGVDNDNKTEYASWRDYDKSSKTWGAFNKPIIWSHYGERGMDGDGVEYVFIRTQTGTAPTITDSTNNYNNKKYTDDEYLPLSSAGRCTDDPTGVTVYEPFEWVAKRSKGSPDANGVRSWEKYSGTMSLWAKWGESSVHLELDNEYDSIIYIKGVKFNLVTVKARLYEGTEQKSIDSSEWSCAGQLQLFSKQMSKDANDPYCQFTFDDAAADLSEQRIKVKYRGVTYERVFTVRKIHDKNRYNIITNPAQIIYNSSTNNISSSTVVINIQKTDCITGAYTTVTDLATEGLTLSVYVNGGSTTRSVSNAGSGNFVFSPDKSHNYYLIKLTSKSDGIEDSETVPVIGVKNGVDGAPGSPGEPGVGFKKINTYTRQYSLALWHSYGDGGHTESWSISGYDNSHINVGDSVYLMGKVSDAKDRAGNMVDVACYGVCSSINSSTIYMATTFIIVGGTAGERGATMRGPQQWDDLPSNYQFYSGGAGEPYVDVVIRNGNYYMCTTTHKKSSSWQSSYWSGTQQVDIVATKLLLANYAYLKNLGAGAIVMYDNSGYTSEDHIVFMAKDGVISCKVGTFENVTVSGTLKGVTGTFNWLDCVDSNGNKVGRICASTGAYGGVAFESVDVVHQGTKDGRSLRFLASDIWCRGNFGAESRNTAVITGSTIKYYTKGVSKSPVTRSLQSYTSSAGKTYYKVPCYGSYGDASGFPVDLLIFSINSSTTYYYVLEMTPTKRMMVFNANDDENNVVIFYNGREFTVDGGMSGEVFQMPPDFMIPVPASNVLGRGLIVSGTRDINWG